MARKGLGLLLVLLLTIGVAVPAFAATKTTLKLEVRIGSTTAVINGEKQKIEKPYQQKGTTLVPLGVFHRAFGTTSRLEANNTVRVSGGSSRATFTIGSQIAWINGKKSTLTAAPVMKNGTLMVPMRLVTDMLKAKVNVNQGTIVVTFVSATGIPGKEPTDQEKTPLPRVGNSYANWSIDYPEDAVAQADDDGLSSTIMNLDGSYILRIYTWDRDKERKVDLSPSDMLEQMERETVAEKETIIDSRIVSDTKFPYAKLVVRDVDGVLWELRRYSYQGHIYSVYMGDSLLEDYREFEQWQPLLDSFRPIFATKGVKTEDLSTAKDGYNEVSAYEYGVTLQVPANWTSTGEGQMEYEAEDGSFLSLHVTTAAGSGANTLPQWHELLQKRTDEFFLKEYAERVSSEKVKASDTDAQAERVTFNLGSGNQHWSWLVFKENGYFYVIRYSAPEGAYQEEVFRKIINSIQIDFEVVPETFGKLGQISYLKDTSLTATQSVDDLILPTPAYWTTQPTDSSEVDLSYFLPGGSFRLTTVDAGIEAAAAQKIRDYEDQKLDDKTLNVATPERTTVAGVPAIRITSTGTDENPYQAEDWYFRRGNLTYWIHVQLDQGTATPQQLSKIQQTIQSISFASK
ncbi:stalk domain-containing protein [Saccharibacillus sp. JS10]|uniref:stalk domain-containing protein n=1 Tax=Saccharibacillus sp. JS10 TaxID=2950552 RepID=UPI00210CC6B1|nr:stalk domain-containing protein [Saccharibacillus sp. JS10]MCQ4088756.1 copper amine oxidase N-terminal domain-containing protein [Saccharibacillus sp. JS10]